MEMLDIETRSWLELPSMLQKRNGACCCIFEKHRKIFVLGGMSIDDGVLDSIERFSMVEQTWELLSVRLVSPLRDFVCHSIGKNRLLILGSPDQQEQSFTDEAKANREIETQILDLSNDVQDASTMPKSI